MAAIARFSLAYDADEDRLAVDAKAADGQIARLWLTQRLCRGLVRALVPMLGTAAPADRALGGAAALQAWEQAAAMATFGRTPGVQSGAEAPAALMRAIHIRRTATGLELTFELAGGETRAVGLDGAAVRQMLAELHRLSAAADWPLDIWPDWISAAPAGAGPVN